MKKIFSLLVVLITLSTAIQAQKVMNLDKSPMDRAYYPVNFAHDRKAGDKAVARVFYSRPAKKEREVFGKLVPYDKVWRAGANESTEIKFYQDVTIGGKKLSAGTLLAFCNSERKRMDNHLQFGLRLLGCIQFTTKKVTF